ncbi:MAG: class I SAM-dependent methyltransferase [Chloroflexota bacterium]
MIATLFHAHYSHYTEDLPFWHSLADAWGGPLLELGCGTGRVLSSLATARHIVWGIDRDASMLSELRKRLTPALSTHVRLLQADMTNFALAQHFPLIIMPCNTFSTLQATDRGNTLKRIWRHLTERGCFAASMPNPEKLQRLPAHGESEIEDWFTHPLDGHPVQVSSGWKRTSNEITIWWHYDHLLPDGRIERKTMQTNHQICPAEEYLSHLETEGLWVADLYGDYNRQLFTPQSDHLIFLAHKRDTNFS